MYVNIQDVMEIGQAFKRQKDKGLESMLNWEKKWFKSTVHQSDLYHVQLFQTDIKENNNQDAETKGGQKAMCFQERQITLD